MCSIDGPLQAQAFLSRLEAARAEKRVNEAALDARDARCPACAGSGFVASDEPYQLGKAVPCGWCQ
jgi:hypothetical protein